MSNATERKRDFSKNKVFVMNLCVSLRVVCQIDECHQKMAISDKMYGAYTLFISQQMNSKIA